jgi:hypothetical protein
MEKKMSIRIRQNDFKRVSKNGKNYKSVIEQIMHDYRKEKIEEGYLLNPQNKNINFSNNELRNDKNMIDLENLKSNIDKLFEEVKKDYKENNNRSWQKKTKPFLTGVISFSSEFMPNEEDSQKLHRELCNFINKTFTNILTCSTHRDEKSFHFHFTIFNYDFNQHKTIGRNINTSELQDKLFEFLDSKSLTYGHKRGTSKKLTKTKHLEVMEAKRLEIENQKKQIEEQNKVIEELKSTNETLKNDKQKLISDNKTLIEQKETIEAEGRKIKKELYEELRLICEDIIKMGEEKKGKNILQTAASYFDKDQNERFEKLFNKAQKIKSKVSKTSKPIR